MNIKNDNNNDIKKEDFEDNITIKRNLVETEENDRSIKVIVVGDTSVGKSSLLYRLINQEIYDLPNTLGEEYHTYLLSLNSYTICMQIWDTVGQEKYKSVINNYYKGTDMAIYVYFNR